MTAEEKASETQGVALLGGLGHRAGRLERGDPCLEAAGSMAEAAEQRDALRLGRLLLGGHEVSL